MHPVNVNVPHPFLPLSWRYNPAVKAPLFEQQKLPLSTTHWITLADLPVVNLSEAFQQHSAYVIRGVHPLFLRQAPAGQSLLTGREAMLNLKCAQHVNRRSIQSLVRRGLRHGSIVTIDLKKEPLPLPIQSAFQTLESQVNIQHQVPLIHMYRRGLNQSDRVWFFMGDSSLLGAISLVHSGPTSWHTEVLMRAPNAPVGIMEALVNDVFRTLAQEDQHFWSLGEVPFYPTAPPQMLQSKAIVFTGQHIEYAYHSKGLLQFKEKFKPFWRPVYLYGYPRLRWLDLASMFWSSQTPRLMAAKIPLLFNRKHTQ